MKEFKFNKQTKKLLRAILAIKTSQEAEAFFRDLCTVDEIKEMTERWQIVQSLEKDVPYRKIAEKLKVSTTTVSRVALWLNNGMGGYKLIYNRLNNHHDRSSLGKGSR